jgi:hypothetical protein
MPDRLIYRNSLHHLIRTHIRGLVPPEVKLLYTCCIHVFNPHYVVGPVKEGENADSQ